MHVLGGDFWLNRARPTRFQVGWLGLEGARRLVVTAVLAVLHRHCV
jgi:hypothetical protein